MKYLATLIAAYIVRDSNKENGDIVMISNGVIAAMIVGPIVAAAR